jgi:hypothetical protein
LCKVKNIIAVMKNIKNAWRMTNDIWTTESYKYLHNAIQ